MGIGKSDAPDPPDYAGAAQATAAGDLEAARVAAMANRVSQYTPYGNLVYSQVDPNNPDQWRSDVTLAPAQQQLLDQQNKISLGLAGAENKGLDYVNSMMATPMDTSGFTNPTAANAGGTQEVYAAMLDRMQPQMDRRRQQSEDALMIQGHNRGGQAWNANEDDIARAENDAQLAAMTQAQNLQSNLINTQEGQRQQQLSEAGYLRNEPVNTLNAVRTGSQVSNPTFTQAPMQATTSGPNLLGAAQAGYQGQLNNYNAQQAGNSNLMGGLFSLGGKALPYIL